MNVSFQLNNLLHDQHNLLRAVEEPPSHAEEEIDAIIIDIEDYLELATVAQQCQELEHS